MFSCFKCYVLAGVQMSADGGHLIQTAHTGETSRHPAHWAVGTIPWGSHRCTEDGERRAMSAVHCLLRSASGGQPSTHASNVIP